MMPDVQTSATTRRPPPDARALPRLVLGFAVTFFVMFLTPLVSYGSLAALGAIEPPQDAPGSSFFLGVVVMKVGIALGFVLLYDLGRVALSGRWAAYALIWWVMYAVVEAGQAIGPGYGWAEAGAGVVAEAIYFPLSAWLLHRILRGAAPPREGP